MNQCICGCHFWPFFGGREGGREGRGGKNKENVGHHTVEESVASWDGPYQFYHSWRDSKLLHGTLGFSPLSNSSLPALTGRPLPHRGNAGQLIIYQSTLLCRTWQLLSAQDSCTLRVWSSTSVSANATRLTSLMMPPHFEGTTQSLIKNSDSFSPACWFFFFKKTVLPPEPRNIF